MNKCCHPFLPLIYNKPKSKTETLPFIVSKYLMYSFLKTAVVFDKTDDMKDKIINQIKLKTQIT